MSWNHLAGGLSVQILVERQSVPEQWVFDYSAKDKDSTKFLKEELMILVPRNFLKIQFQSILFYFNN